MHPLVVMQHLTRQEFLRGLQGLTEGEARRRLEPMNCISWTIGHMAAQEHAFFVARPQGREVKPEYKPFLTGSQPSQPSLEEMMTLWRATCDNADAWLHAVTEERLKQRFSSQPRAETAGTLLVRNIFHYWSHIGEINAARQMLGHVAPQFVDMHGWQYGEG